METKKKLNKNAEEPAEIQELTQEELDQVNGAGDPFADVPRVPEKPIDPGLRDDG